MNYLYFYWENSNSLMVNKIFEKFRKRAPKLYINRKICNFSVYQFEVYLDIHFTLLCLFACFLSTLGKSFYLSQRSWEEDIFSPLYVCLFVCQQPTGHNDKDIVTKLRDIISTIARFCKFLVTLGQRSRSSPTVLKIQFTKLWELGQIMGVMIRHCQFLVVQGQRSW